MVHVDGECRYQGPGGGLLREEVVRVMGGCRFRGGWVEWCMRCVCRVPECAYSVHGHWACVDDSAVLSLFRG